MSDHRTYPTPHSDDASGLSPLYADAAEAVRAAVAAAFRPGRPLDLGDVAAAAALMTAARWLLDRGHFLAAAILDPDARPGWAVDARTADEMVALERERVRWVPVVDDGDVAAAADRAARARLSADAAIAAAAAPVTLTATGRAAAFVDVPLFDDAPPARELARATDPDTSHAAAAAVDGSPRRESQLRALLTAYSAAGRSGLTDEHAARVSGVGTDGGHYTKRCSDLRRLGYIAPRLNDDDGTPMTRPGSSGRAARVCAVTGSGHAALLGEVL